MLRGNKKKIYHITRVGGKYFDEAYFVMRDGVDGEESPSSTDLAAEADRIIREAAGALRAPRRRLTHAAKNAVIFAVGALSSSVLIAIIALALFGG